MNVSNLDAKDRAIIAQLKKDARMSYSDIGQAVGLSRTAVKNRMQALEGSGVITGYSVRLDSPDAGEKWAFVVNVETKAENFQDAYQALSSSPHVITLIQTTGSCHFLAICTANDAKEIRDFVRELYNTVPGILSINQHTVLDVIKGRLLPEG